VLYGGEKATVPRNELLAWLRGPAVQVDAQLVAEEAPHSDGAVDERVDEKMNWADKAIALLTPDDRGLNGAPNVIDEIGRWRSSKGKRSLCLVRQQGVPPYSNHAGIVYIEFKQRVSEKFEDIRRFLGLTRRAYSTWLLIFGGAVLLGVGVILGVVALRDAGKSQPDNHVTTPKPEPERDQQPKHEQQPGSLEVSESQARFITDRLKEHRGKVLRLVRIGNKPAATIAYDTIQKTFAAAGWSVQLMTIGMSVVSGPNFPSTSYLSSEQVSDPVVRAVYKTFLDAGVNLPLVPDAELFSGGTQGAVPNAVIVVQ
jgi:hypothetical protein